MSKETTDNNNADIVSIVGIITAILHLIVLIIYYKDLGFWQATGAIFLFTFFILAGIKILQWILPVVGVFIAGTIVYTGYNAGNWGGAFKSLLYAVAFIVASVILIFIGPPILSGYFVYLVYNTVFGAIVVGLIFAVVWFYFIRYAPWAVLALFAGGIANKLTLIVLGVISKEYYTNTFHIFENSLSVDSFDKLMSLLFKIIGLIDLSWYMVVWCLVLGVVYRYIKNNESNDDAILI